MKPWGVVLMLAAANIVSAGMLWDITIASNSWAAGCFECVVPPFVCCDGGNILTFHGLTYKGANLGFGIDINTTNGHYAFDAPAYTPPSPINIESGNLGSLLLGGSTFDYTGTNFFFRVAIFGPIISPVDYIVTTGVLRGSVTDGVGSVLLDFDNTPILYTYAGGGGGTFTFTFHDVTVLANGPPVALSAEINSVTLNAPEPASFYLTGLGAAILVWRNVRNAVFGTCLRQTRLRRSPPSRNRDRNLGSRISS